MGTRVPVKQGTPLIRSGLTLTTSLIFISPPLADCTILASLSDSRLLTSFLTAYPFPPCPIHSAVRNSQSELETAAYCCLPTAVCVLLAALCPSPLALQQSRLGRCEDSSSSWESKQLPLNIQSQQRLHPSCG